jgi:hypothetical protein
MLYLRFLLYYAFCDRSAEMKGFEIQGNEKKVDFAVSLSDMPVERTLFITERCYCVGRDATL